MFYETISNLGNEVRRGQVLETLKFALKSAPAGLQLTAHSFETWATAACGNCGEMGSHDGALWAESICDRNGLNWNSHRASLALAMQKGKRNIGTSKTRRSGVLRRQGKLRFLPTA